MAAGHLHTTAKNVFHNSLAISVLKQHENSVIYNSPVGYNTCVASVRQFYTGYATIAIELKQQANWQALCVSMDTGYWGGKGRRGGSVEWDVWKCEYWRLCYLCLVTSVRPLAQLSKKY